MPVYIICMGPLKQQILELYPACGRYVVADVVLYCRLNKALYGCVQASKLWYEKRKKFLWLQGYVHRDVDPCVLKEGSKRYAYLLLP
jgi:hypothetical protein